MLRALWLVVAHDLLEYRYMDDVRRNLFSFWKCLWDYFGKRMWKLPKKFKRELFTKKRNEEKETKRVLDNLRMPKLEEIFTAVLIRDSQFCKMFSRLFCFEQVKARKSFSENLFMLWFNFVHTPLAHLPYNCTLFAPQNFAQALFSISLGTAVIPRGNEMKKKKVIQNFGGQIRCFMGDVQVAYGLIFIFLCSLSCLTIPKNKGKKKTRIKLNHNIDK